MPPLVGIIAAFVAFLSWGFGDFAIQRTVRRIGKMEALFFITAFGAIVLLPFVWHDLPSLLRERNVLLLLIVTVAITLVTALVEFAAFERGKLSVIEPIMSFEVVITAAIGIGFLQETITGIQGALAFLVFTGIMLTVLHRPPRHWWDFWLRRSWVERGAILGVIGMVLMSATNILTGLSSQQSNPLLAIWFIHTGLALITLVWFLARGNLRDVLSRGRRNWQPVLAESVFDNLAWLGFAFAVQALPISITIAITESYIALAALLGVLLNKEKLQRHQFVGMGIALVMAILLAVVTA